LGDGAQYFGASITGGTDVLPLVDAEDAGDALCTPGALDPSVVAGNIVLCERGVIARVSKSQAVFLAGGSGMILFNVNDSQDLVTDNHYVPSVHINNTDGLAIKAYIDSAGSEATAQIFGGVSTPVDAPWMADFSSRGPNPVATDIIKPDVTAPGVNILAGNSPTALLGAPGELFQSISGTSMSSPHVAGVYALLKQDHPDWSPAMAKSALMTTAYQDVMKEGAAAPADPFDMGAGHINPGGAWTEGSLTDPGLVYDAGFNDYLGFLCGAAPEIFFDPAGTCAALEARGFLLDPSDLNLASIAIGELVGSQTITRTVTSVAEGSGNRVYTVSVDAPAGFDISVSPSTLKLRSGRSATYTVTFSNNGGASTGEWAFGSLTWEEESGLYSVRSPIALRPFQVDAPAEVSGTGTSGSLSFDVKFGYDGDYSAAPHGLIPADKQPDTVVDDPANDINIALTTGVGVTFHEFTIPDGTVHARFSLFDEFTDGNDDLDLYVFGPESAGFPFVGGSGTATSAEQVDLAFPEPGLYLVVVHGWQTDGPDANYTLFSWAVGPDAGNMTVSGPTTATLNGTATIDVSWSGLVSGEKYLGAVSHNDSSGILDLTLVNINTE
jgi:hypothetical protein